MRIFYKMKKMLLVAAASMFCVGTTFAEMSAAQTPELVAGNAEATEGETSEFDLTAYEEAVAYAREFQKTLNSENEQEQEVIVAIDEYIQSAADWIAELKNDPEATQEDYDFVGSNLKENVDAIKDRMKLEELMAEVEAIRAVGDSVVALYPEETRTDNAGLITALQSLPRFSMWETVESLQAAIDAVKTAIPAFRLENEVLKLNALIADAEAWKATLNAGNEMHAQVIAQIDQMIPDAKAVADAPESVEAVEQKSASVYQFMASTKAYLAQMDAQAAEEVLASHENIADEAGLRAAINKVYAVANSFFGMNEDGETYTIADLDAAVAEMKAAQGAFNAAVRFDLTAYNKAVADANAYKATLNKDDEMEVDLIVAVEDILGSAAEWLAELAADAEATQEDADYIAEDINNRIALLKVQAESRIVRAEGEAALALYPEETRSDNAGLGLALRNLPMVAMGMTADQLQVYVDAVKAAIPAFRMENEVLKLNALIADAEAWKATLNADNEMHAQVIAQIDQMIPDAKAVADAPESVEAVEQKSASVYQFMAGTKAYLAQMDAQAAQTLMASYVKTTTDEAGLGTAINKVYTVANSFLGMNEDGATYTIADLDAAVAEMKAAQDAFMVENAACRFDQTAYDKAVAAANEYKATLNKDDEMEADLIVAVEDILGSAAEWLAELAADAEATQEDADYIAEDINNRIALLKVQAESRIVRAEGEAALALYPEETRTDNAGLELALRNLPMVAMGMTAEQLQVYVDAVKAAIPAFKLENEVLKLNALIADAEAWKATLNADNEMHAQVIAQIDQMIPDAKAVADAPESVEAVEQKSASVYQFMASTKAYLAQMDAQAAEEVLASHENIADEAGLRAAIDKVYAVANSFFGMNEDGVLYTIADLDAAVAEMEAAKKAFLDAVATGIQGIQAGQLAAPADIYDINGRLVKKSATSTEGLQKGLYIVNGKKLWVK